MGTLSNTYLVGGAVRDQLMGIASKDRDYVVVGETPETMLASGFKPVGADFPVFLHPESKEEYALARTERKSGRGYHGFDIASDPSVTLEDDLARRDLTINAMAFDNNGQLIDPYNGYADLQAKMLRHTTEAFAEDPLRVLRVARFMARYGNEWQIHPDTQRLMLSLRDSGEMSHLVPERVWKETEKALMEPHPHLYFEILLGFGVFPELEAMVGIPQPAEYHPEGDVFTHTMLVVKRAAELGFDLSTRFAALTHDFGKASSYEAHGRLAGHEQEGVEVIKAFCQRLKLPNYLTKIALLMSDNHTRCHRIFSLTPKKLHKLLVTKLDALAQPLRLEQILNACICDVQGRGPTMVNTAYPQADFAKALVECLTRFDKKAAAREAITMGKTGEAIGEWIRVKEIDEIRAYLKEQHQ